MAPDADPQSNVPQLIISSDMTLDLNGKTLGYEEGIGELPSTPVLIAVDGADVVIEGDGTIDAEAGSNNSYAIDIVNGGSLTINGGNFYGGTTAVQVTKGKLVVNDGNFDLTEACPDSYAKFVVNCIDANFKDGTAVIELRGGTYPYDFSANPEGENTSYVAEGYGVVQTTEGDRTVYEVLSVAENPDAVFAASSANALVALLNGGAQNVMLSEDVTFSEKIAFTEDAAIDLNDKTLTLNSGAMSNGILNGAHLTFKNGTLKATIGDGSPTAKANFIVSGANSSLTLENVDYTANGTAIYVQGDGTDDAATASKIVIKGSTIKGGGYAVGTNASVKDGDNAYKNVNIEVTKSELYATLGSGILFNVAGKLTVSGSTICGAEQGIFLRAGTAEISDSTLGTSYNKTDEYLTKDWGSGTSGVRAALTLGNRNGTYYADAVCTLRGEIKFVLAEDTKAPLIYVYANKDVDEGINDGKPFTTTLDYTAATGVGSKDIVVGEGSAAVKVIPAQP